MEKVRMEDVEGKTRVWNKIERSRQGKGLEVRQGRGSKKFRQVKGEYRRRLDKAKGGNGKVRQGKGWKDFVKGKGKIGEC